MCANCHSVKHGKPQSSIAFLISSVLAVLLQLTPIPALPAYYCLYRAFSHRQALAGCRSLTDAFSHNDAQQLQVRLLWLLADLCPAPHRSLLLLGIKRFESMFLASPPAGDIGCDHQGTTPHLWRATSELGGHSQCHPAGQATRHNDINIFAH